VLVPYPYATSDHQTLNARHFERGGGAVLVPEEELDRVPPLVDELLGDSPRLARMRTAMLAMARPEAADEIAEELIALAARR
jgi:UDP-N-acetylglucosamine--N-acetylmuramyl-(pentapeptide) pyrophosphoryl-undecaprenol N-acetylglucosamine transferase